MHWLRFAALTLIATLMQYDLIDTVSVAGVSPDLLIIILAFFAIYANQRDAIIASFVIGIAHDIIQMPIGPEIISFTILGVGLNYLGTLLNLKKMSFQAGIIFIFGFATIIISNILSRLQGTVVFNDTPRVIFGTPFYSAIIGPFLFLPIAWIMKIKIHHKRRRR